MNECGEFCDAVKYRICRGCLKTDEHVRRADETLVIKYKNLLSQYSTQIPSELFFCIYCISIINKITKYIQQCLDVDRRIDEFYNEVPQSYLTLRLSDVKIYNYLPESETVDAYTKYEDDYQCDGVSDDDDDLPLVMLKSDEPIETELNVITDNIKIENVDEVFVKQKKQRKRKRLGFNKIDEYKIKEESLFNEDNAQPAKKALREGFTSRMVQETDAYVVIKLSKKQVINEMIERSKSEKYSRAPFKCEKCVKGFNFEDVLMTHLEKHTTKNGTIKCEICSQYCPNVISMRGHMKSHTTRYKCKSCSVIRLSRQHLLEHHTNTHTAESVAYSCSQCTYYTFKRTAMQRHARTHSSNQRYSCETCGKVFKNKESLRAHILRHENMKKYVCPICDRSFLYPSLLRAHMTSHDNAQEHYCVECDVKFKTRENLKTHFKKSKAHRDPNTLIFKCASCSSKFQTEALLRSHVSSRHESGGDGRVRCSQCDKVYSSTDTLRAHVRRVHRAEGAAKTHACHYCHLSFAQRAVLVKHIRVHTGERPYACHECGLAFAQHATRHTHLRLVHKKLPRSVKKSQEIQLNNHQQSDVMNQQVLAS